MRHAERGRDLGIDSARTLALGVRQREGEGRFVNIRGMAAAGFLPSSSPTTDRVALPIPRRTITIRCCARPKPLRWNAAERKPQKPYDPLHHYDPVRAIQSPPRLQSPTRLQSYTPQKSPDT